MSFFSDEYLSKIMCASSRWSVNISCTYVASANLRQCRHHRIIIGFWGATSLCTTQGRHRASSVSEDDACGALSRLRTSTPITVKRSRVFTKSVQKSKYLYVDPQSILWRVPTCPMNTCRETHANIPEIVNVRYQELVLFSNITRKDFATTY